MEERVPLIYRCMRTKYTIDENGNVYNGDMPVYPHLNINDEPCVGIVTPAGYVNAYVDELIYRNFIERPSDDIVDMIVYPIAYDVIRYGRNSPGLAHGSSTRNGGRGWSVER